MPSRDEYCPVAKSVEILGDRWCLLLVREMLRGVRRFNELERSMPGISRSILAQRLRHLEREGIAERRVEADGRSVDYVLTDAGRELGSVVGALNDWGVRWRIPNAQPTELDPDGLMLWIRRHVVLDELPPRRVVVEFHLRVRAGRRRSYWLVLQSGEASLCPEYPGFPEDIRITAAPAMLYDVFLGRITLGAAMADDTIRVDAAPSQVRAMSRWFRLSGPARRSRAPSGRP